jgi:predicted amidophosphoribosyltransferase
MSGGAGLAQRALDLLFPPRCVSCGTGGALLCARCRGTIRAPEPPLCSLCGRSLGAPLDAGAPTRQAESICPFCAAGERPASLDGLRAATVYEGAVRQAILELNFSDSAGSRSRWRACWRSITPAKRCM